MKQGTYTEQGYLSPMSQMEIERQNQAVSEAARAYEHWTEDELEAFAVQQFVNELPSTV